MNGDSIKINEQFMHLGKLMKVTMNLGKATFTALNYLLDNGADAT